MKNFTNNFKQFTSRLSARWLIMALMMLVGTSSAWAAIYLKGSFNGWGASNTFDGNGNCTITLSKGNYTFKIDDGGTWYGNGESITRSNCLNVSIGGSNGSDMKLDVDVTGSYKFYWNGYDKKLTVTYPQACTQCCDKVEIKHPWGGGDWTYKTAEKCDGTVYSLEAKYGNNGCNWKLNDGSENWISQQDSKFILVGKPSKGDDCTFSFNTSNNTITITKVVTCDDNPDFSVSLSKSEVAVGCTGVTASIKGDDRPTVTWSPSDPKVATIGSDGAIIINAAGTTTITATTTEADGFCGGVEKKATLTVKSPSVKVSPNKNSLCEDETLTLTATLTNCGADNSIQWYKGEDLLTGETKDQLTISSVTTTNSGEYKAVVTGGIICSSIESSAVTITVNALPGAPTLSPNTDEVCSGKEFTLPGDYNWYEISTGGTKLNSATISGGITSNKSYWAEAKNASGCVSSTRTEYTLTVNDKPAVPTLSADKTSLIGEDKAVFTVGNTVSGLTYTLYNGETDGESQTSTGSDLTFKAGGEGSYTVRVTNSCGTSISTPAVDVTVCTPQTNEFRHADNRYAQLQAQPTYYPGDKAYFVSTIDCCLTGTWSANLQKGEEAWYTGLKGGTPRFYMTLTRAGEFTITNMATNNCTQDRNVLVNLDFTVTALSEVTNANGTASGADIALTWEQSANHTKVMVVRYPTAGTETIPAGGQSYSAGNTLGEGTVVYVGTDEIYTDKNLPAGVSYKYYFYTVNNNYYSEGVVLNMSSCPVPAKPVLTSTAVTTCNGNVTTFGSITITNMADYKDDTYTFKLGDIPANLDANGITISSANYTEYTVTVINSCGNQNSANVDIAINNITPTISGATIAQPGKQNKIELTVPDGITAKWSVSPEADLSVSEGNSTMFSAETNGIYTIKATNGTCSDTHVVTVADAFYVYMRQPKKGETAYNNFYYPAQNPTQGGDLFYKEYSSIPPAEGYTDYNQGGRAHDVILTDCDGYVWYGFKASAQLIAGTNYFTVHALNKNGYDGWYTHTDITKPGKMTGDIYYIMGTEGNGNSGWKIEEASAPYSGPVVHASGSTTLGADKFAALYVTDCSGKEITGYQWYKDGQPYSSVCSYVGKKGSEDSNAGETNNIRPTVAGNYSCTVTYEDRTTATSAAVEISGSYNRSFTSNIPVLVVNTGSKGFPDCTGLSDQTASKNASTFKAKRSVDVKIYEGETLVYDRKARMNYRGSSSLNFVKKSYAFCPGDANCEEKDGQADYVKTAKLNMLGVGKACDKDWVLYAAAADPSLMRNRLVFDSYKAMTGKWGVNSRYVELIVDGVYKGVYVFMDKITMNENRVEVNEDKGFIVKFDKTDREDRVGGLNGVLGDEKTFKTSNTGKDDIGTYDTSIDQRFEIEYPEKDDYKTGWKARVDGIQGMFQAFEDALKQGDYATVQKYIDYTSWADWFIINEFTKNVDAYRASCIFVYTGEAGAKIEARPLWDQELSFNNQASKGTSDKGSNSTTGLLIQHSNVYSDAFKAPFWFTGGGSDITGGLLSDPCFVQVVKERWNIHQFGALSKKSLEDLVDKYEDDLAPEGTTENALTRETAFWDGKSRGKCDCSYETNNPTATGYQNKTFEESKGTITNWISDDAASGAKGRRAGLTTAINGLTGASFSIQIIPSVAYTTPWEPVEIAVSVTPAGYDYKLEYTGDNNLGGVANTIIKEEGDKIIYRIPRPDAWGTGDELVEGERTDIEYGIKATLSVQEGTTVCGSQAAPSSTGKIILQDEDNEKCQQP